MNYAKIRKMDISNGEGIRATLFVQGCQFYCKGCFNVETWDFKGGKPFGEEELNKIVFEAGGLDYIDGITILGGEPLHECNCIAVKEIVDTYKKNFPNKTVWIYTGYTFEHLENNQLQALENVDVLVDGLFVQELKDPHLKFRGSSNQRLIDIQETLKNGKVVLYDN